MACRFAASPTNRSPVLVNATTDGVIRRPSEFSRTLGSPPSMTAMQEFVVPKSMPMTFAIKKLVVFLNCRADTIVRNSSSTRGAIDAKHLQDAESLQLKINTSHSGHLQSVCQVCHYVTPLAHYFGTVGRKPPLLPPVFLV